MMLILFIQQSFKTTIDETPTIKVGKEQRNQHSDGLADKQFADLDLELKE